MNAITPCLSQRAIPHCPCCGREVGAVADLLWNPESRTLSGRGAAVVLSPSKGRIFDLLWRKFSSGRSLDKRQIMDFLYADDPNGGPDTDDCIKQQVYHLKKQIEPFGLSVKGRTGYQLVVPPSSQPENAT